MPSTYESLSAGMIGVGFEGTTLTDSLKRIIDRGVSAVIFFKRNFKTVEQFIQLTFDIKRYADRPIALGLDQEGGRVIRLTTPFSQLPSARLIGNTQDPVLAKNIGKLVGAELRAANIDINFAPVMDVDTNPKNPVIGDRSFGRTSQIVSQMGTAIIEGLQSQNVAACAKHFPGHGDTHQDSHFSLPFVAHSTDRLREIELKPFVAAANAKVAAIMTSHIIFQAIDTLPATMSQKILQTILRQEINFQGVVISDDLEMKAITNHFSVADVLLKTIQASVDLLLICHTHARQNEAIDLIIKAIEQKKLPLKLLQEAQQRRQILFERYVKPAEHSYISEIIGCQKHQKILSAFQSHSAQRDPTDMTTRPNAR